MLAAIIVLAAVIRIPGIFWGYHFFGGPTKVALHTDEMYGVKLTNQFLKKEINFGEGYPLAQSFQVAALAWPLRKFLHFPFITIFYLGRLNSLFFGLLTVFLVGLTVRKISGRDEVGLLAAFFMATSDLAATYSHIFIPDMAAVFWLYLSFYLTYLFWKTGNFELIGYSAFAAAAAAASKFNNIFALVVLLLAGFFSSKKFWALFLIIFTAAGSFYLLNGASFTWRQFLGTGQYLATYTSEQGNAFILLNLFLIPVNILMAVGGPVFLLFLTALGFLVKIIFRGRDGWKLPPALTFGLGLGLYFIFIFAFRMMPARFVLPLVPAIAMAAAWAFYKIPFLSDNRKWLLPLLFCYQLLYTVPAQANFVFEPREAAGRWLKQNLPAGAEVSVSAQAFVPTQLKTTFKMNRPTLVLAEQGYERYLTKNNLNYKLTGKLPELKEIYNPNLEYGSDPLILQKILTGQSGYRLKKKFKPFVLTPEWGFWEWLGYHPSLLGKVLIYQKNESQKNSR